MDYEKIEVARFSTMEDRQPVATTLGSVVGEIKGGTLRQLTAEYRKLQALDPESDALRRMKKQLPSFLPSAVVRGGRRNSDIRGFTGLVMVDIDHIPPQLMEGVEAKIRADEHTVVEYTTVSGRGKRIIAYVDGEVTAGNWGRVWTAVNGYYSRLCGVATDGQCKNATRISGMCDAPDAYFCPKALPFLVSSEKRVVSSEPTATTANDGAAPLLTTHYSLHTKNGELHTIDGIAERVKRMVESKGCRYADGSHNQYIANCLYLMNRFGVDEDEATRWALSEFADYDAREHSVAATARSCYQNTGEHGSLSVSGEKRGAGNKSKRAAPQELTAFMDGYMQARYNLFSNAVEVKIGGDDDWKRLTDRIENTLWMKMHEAGINAEVTHIHQLLTSDYVGEFHPLRDYLEGLKPWDGKTDHIGRLAAMVHVGEEEQQLFADAFRRWIVALIAGVLRDDTVNQTILVLIGRQGCYKTSFAQNILPPSLRRYYTMKANSQRITKDDLFTMTEYMIVNLEEIDTMPAAELNQLKAMVTQTHVDERVPYGRNKDHRAHICSFFATGNNEQFLTDETGNRRWLPFKVERIDNPWTAKIPHDQIYAQAYALYNKGDFKYWFDDDEVQRLRSHVTAFETPRAEVEMILAHYRKPHGLERYSFVTSSQIAARFGTASLRLSNVKVGKAMKELGFDMERRRDSRYWKVVERTADEVNFSLPDDNVDSDVPF